MVEGIETPCDEAWRSFVERASETDFAQVVRRHVNLVYSVALRRCGGDAALAEDVTQRVFVDLSRNARSVPRGMPVAGWLHRHAGFVASTAMRSEERRRVRERTAMELQETNSDAEWERLAPVLDEALDALPEGERNAVVLRFLDRQSFAQVGGRLGVSADAARMRVDRALDRLRGLLERQGVTSTTAALAMALGERGVVAAPSGLSAGIAALASHGVAIGTAGAPGVLGFMTATQLKVGVSALVAAGALTTGYLEHLSALRSRGEVAAVRAELAAASAHAAPAGDALSEAELAQLREDRRHLMALRDEVGRLRELQRASAAKDEEIARLRVEIARATRPAASKSTDEVRQAEEDAAREKGIARMNYAKAWVMAAILFAEKNDGTMPDSFGAAAEFYPKYALEWLAGFDSNQFEWVYRGSLKNLTHPERTIVLREREAYPGLPPPGSTAPAPMMRSYGFADGHSEIHAAQDGQFEAWERERMVPAP